MQNQDTHSKVIGYLLWIFGFMGAHRFYYGRQLTGTQALGQAARWQKLGLSLDAAGERHGVEVRHGADSLGH